MMTDAEFQQRILGLAVKNDSRVTVASVTLHLRLEGKTVQRKLDAMVVNGLFELDSYPDGAICYRAMGLQAMSSSEVALALQPRSSLANRAFQAATIVSVLDFVAVGLAALMAYPKWEAELLLWIALAGAPLSLAALVRIIGRRIP